MSPIRTFVFGLGYSGTAFARAMLPKASWTGGTVRSVDKAVALSGERLRTFIFDGRSKGVGVAAAVRQATHVLVSIAPGESDPTLVHHHRAIAGAHRLAWLGYLSTVGVYGDHDGGPVDETTVPKPARGRSMERLVAEKAWQAMADEAGVPLAIFRVAGIYGPGRNALVNLAAGRARRIIKPGQVFNRIHVEDLVAAAVAAAERKADGVFNLADDAPGPPQDVVAYAAHLMGVPVPPDMPFDEADLSPMARSFYGDNKRVTNARIKDELGVTLRYPTYRDGLDAMWRNGTWQGEGATP